MDHFILFHLSLLGVLCMHHTTNMIRQLVDSISIENKEEEKTTLLEFDCFSFDLGGIIFYISSKSRSFKNKRQQTHKH